MLQLKINPPAARSGLVQRTSLLDDLEQPGGARVVFITAPAGYGKTTTAMQWSERVQSAAAWLTLDRADDDPTSLGAHTVKTRAMSIYRKLGVSSRSAAVDRARSVGLWSL